MDEPFEQTMQPAAPRWVGAAAVGGVLAVLAGASALASWLPAGVGLLAALAFVVLAGRAVARAHDGLYERFRPPPVRVRVDARGLVVGGELFPWARVRRVREHHQRLSLRARRLTIDVEGRGLLRFDPHGEGGFGPLCEAVAPALRARRTRYVGRLSVTLWIVGGVALGAACLVAWGVLERPELAREALPRAAAACTLAAFAALALAWARRPVVEVGDEGVMVRRLTRRFLPIAEVEAAVAHLSVDRGGAFVGVEFRCEGRRVVRVPLHDDEETLALARRVVEARDRWQERRGWGAVAGLPRAPEAGTLAGWVTDLRAAGGRAGAHFRAAAPDRERLWRALEDPGALGEERVAAAVALTATGDEGARTRVRVAAEGAAQPELREALATAAGDDDQAVAASIAALRRASRR